MDCNLSAPHPRSKVYYWKCDRPAAFHGTAADFSRTQQHPAIAGALARLFPGQSIELRQAGGQGNHLTWTVDVDGCQYFLRAEDGPERDDYIEVESHILEQVRAACVPAPRVYHVDARREHTSMAWHLIEAVPYADFNRQVKEGRLAVAEIAHFIGHDIACWQAVPVAGYGPFDPRLVRSENRLQGFHACYEDYFRQHLARHLAFLADHAFLPGPRAVEIAMEIDRHAPLLKLDQGVLVHKDLALWNILGDENKIVAYIDWDDAIAGDPMDDLSLLGCFHGGDAIARACQGYAARRPLPPEHRRRFWLHLLRNMVTKAVIRVGAGYFDRNDGFFLIGAGGTGADLRRQTEDRLKKALDGLRNDTPLELL